MCDRLQTIQTDGQTDGQTDILPRHSLRYAYASSGKNYQSMKQRLFTDIIVVKRRYNVKANHLNRK